MEFLKSINFSATNGTLATKGEIESNFLTALTEEPKLNHWVNTILNQIVIQFEPSCLFKQKLISISPYFSKFKRRYYQKIKQNSNCHDTCGKKCYLLFLQNLFLRKNIYFSNFHEISLKREDFFFFFFSLLNLMCHQRFIWTT